MKLEEFADYWGLPSSHRALQELWKRANEYDPYADLVKANQEDIAEVHQDGLKRALKALEKGFPATAELAIRMALCFHPMHAESWPGWPAEPWAHQESKERANGEDLRNAKG